MRTIDYRGYTCRMEWHRYDNGLLALRLLDTSDGGPVATASINLVDTPMGADEMAINHDLPDLGSVLTQAGVLLPGPRQVRGQYVTWNVFRVAPIEG